MSYAHLASTLLMLLSPVLAVSAARVPEPSAVPFSPAPTSALPSPTTPSSPLGVGVPTLNMPATMSMGGVQGLVDASSVTPVRSLDDVIEMLKGSPAWQAANLTYQSAQLALQSAQSQAGLNVQVGGDLSVTKFPWDASEWRNNSSLNLGVGVSVLPWSPALENVRRAERAAQTAAIDLRNARATLALQAAQAYAGARQAVTGAELARSQLSLAARALAIAQDQNAQGVLTRTALLERQGALVSAQTALANAERAVGVAAQQLTRLLGRGVELPKEGNQFAAIKWPIGTLDEATLLVQALKSRPEIAKAEAGILDAQMSLDAAKREQILPDLNAGVRVGQINDGAGGAGNVISGNLNLKTGLLSAQVSVPLRDTSELKNGFAFNLGGTFTILGGGKSSAVSAAALGVQQAELGLSTSRQAVVLEVRTRLSEYQNELENLKPLQTSLERATQSLSDARSRAEAGVATSLEVNQAEANLKQAQNAVLNQQTAISLAALQLAQATGDFDPLLLERK